MTIDMRHQDDFTIDAMMAAVREHNADQVLVTLDQAHYLHQQFKSDRTNQEVRLPNGKGNGKWHAFTIRPTP